MFGKSTRGKRLKSDDRIAGHLPFVTAGEAEEGISAYISNEVEIFSSNTTTIDMFGSAKYRSYAYGADDHIAAVLQGADPAADGKDPGGIPGAGLPSGTAGTAASAGELWALK